MALDIKEFNNTDRLLDIRKDSLNPVIRAAKVLDTKVEGLQLVVAASMTEPSIDATTQRLYFKKGGSTSEYLDLGPLLNTMKHGIDISTPTSAGYEDVSKINFKNATLHKNGDIVDVDFNPVEGQVDSGVTKQLKKVFITGNTAGSSMTADGIMTLNMPSNSIRAKINGADFANIDKIRVTDTSSSSTILGDTLNLQIPDIIVGGLVGSGNQPVKSIRFKGNIGSSTEIGGNLDIDLPMMSGVVAPETISEHITGISVKGNVGDSKIENNILTINLPAGGGGGTGSFDLKVGERNKNPIDNVEEIQFENSEVKTATTKTGNKVLITPRGAPVEIVDKDGTKREGRAKLIQLTGDVETSGVSTTGQLTINIPHHAGLSVTDGSTQTAGINLIEFEDATVTIDSTKAKATIKPNDITGSVGGTTGSIKEIEITGTLGGSGLSGGKLKIDLPAGGGGTGGSTIYGVVGSNTAQIERVEVIGDLTGSSVEDTTKTLKVNIPRKVGIKGGADTYSDIDIVEVANSTVQLDTAGGKRKAFITPHIPAMAEGWFPTMDALNDYIPVGARIPTKTYGFVPDPVTRENVLWIWLPNLTTGVNNWVAMPVAGSLFESSKGTKVRSIYGVERNPMVDVKPDGVMTIKDTTIPDLPVEILGDKGVAVVAKGPVSLVKFEDGSAFTTFDSTNKEITIHRAQRRLTMGSDPAGKLPYLGDDQYEGSIFFNEDDACWWGFHDRTASTPQEKWSKVIHAKMSDQVISLNARVSEVMDIVTVNTSTADATEWQKSSWSYVAKESQAVPEELRQKSGGYIQTFAHEEGSGEKYRTQVFYADIDAAVYKRNWDTASNAWPANWSKVSFNPAELQAHNNDPHAHSKTNPFYKTVSFDCKYKELKDGNKMLPIPSIHFLGASNGKHKINDDMIATIPYDGQFRIRGRLYFSGIPETASTFDKGNWFLSLEKRSKGGAWSEVRKVEYLHDTTSMVYPPLNWDMTAVNLKAEDDLQIKIWFQPTNPGVTEDVWLAKHPNIGFYGLRSFVSVDSFDNDGGYALGETHRKLHGKFVSTDKAGVKATQASAGAMVRVVGEEVATNFTEMKA